jgi:hypothetical protein
MFARLMIFLAFNPNTMEIIDPIAAIQNIEKKMPILSNDLTFL